MRGILTMLLIVTAFAGCAGNYPSAPPANSGSSDCQGTRDSRTGVCIGGR